MPVLWPIATSVVIGTQAYRRDETHQSSKRCCPIETGGRCYTHVVSVVDGVMGAIVTWVVDGGWWGVLVWGGRAPRLVFAQHVRQAGIEVCTSAIELPL